SGSMSLTEPAPLAEHTDCFRNEGGLYEGWSHALRKLNLAHDPQQRIAVGTRLHVPAQLEAAYSRTCAGGRWAALANELSLATATISAAKPAQAARDKASSVARSSAAARTYKVRAGDNLAAIARKTGCAKTEDIARL